MRSVSDAKIRPTAESKTDIAKPTAELSVRPKGGTMQEARYIWMDGELVPWADAKVHVLTHSLHYGLAVFEGIRCYKTKRGPAVFRLPEHLERLYNSAKITRIQIPVARDELQKAILETIKANNYEECYIRPIVYIGHGQVSVYPGKNPIRISIAVWPWGAYLGEEGLKNGVRVKISSYARHHINVMMTGAKVTGNYVNAILAKDEAIQEGYDEALLLDPWGNVAEGAGENFFLVRAGALKTPSPTAILRGITRDSVITMARKMGLEVTEIFFGRDEVYMADEAFFTGTAAEITPIREVDRRPIGTGKPGPVTRKFQDAFFRIVRGEDSSFSHWLTPVE